MPCQISINPKIRSMKNIGTILITALISTVLAIGGYRYFDKKQNQTLFPEESANLHFVKNTASTSSTGNIDFVKAAAVVTPAVVHLKRPSIGSGSGVIISPEGYIVTNNHVVEGGSEIEVVLTDRRTFTGKIVGTDPSTDLALVKVDARNLPVVELGNSDAVQVGEWVLAVGYPLTLNSTVTAGIVSAKGRSIGILSQPTRENPNAGSAAIESFIQTDAAINAGNSGGALVNAAGELIGINAAIASRTGSYAGYGFAIPVNLAKKIVNDFIKFGEVRRGYLGVSFPFPAMEDELLKRQGIKPGTVKGVYITDVQAGSAAAVGGIKAGDIIQSVDGTAVASSSEFSERIARHSPGDKVELSYLRNGRTSNVSVTLKGKSEALSANNNRPEGGELHNKMGATFAPLTSAVKQQFGISSGIMIAEIQRGSFFAEVEIPRGTIIVNVNGRAVNNLNELNRALALTRNGMARIAGITPEGIRFITNFPLGA